MLERLLVYCKLEDIDIDFFVEQKMRFNKLRDTSTETENTNKKNYETDKGNTESAARI